MKNQLLYLFGWTKLSNRSEKWFDCKFLFEPLTLTVGWISARLPSAPFSLYGTLVANLCWSPSRINSGDVSPSAHRGFVDWGPHLRLCCIGGSFVKPAYGYTCTCRLIYSSSLTIRTVPYLGQRFIEPIWNIWLQILIFSAMETAIASFLIYNSCKWNKLLRSAQIPN